MRPRIDHLGKMQTEAMFTNAKVHAAMLFRVAGS